MYINLFTLKYEMASNTSSTSLAARIGTWMGWLERSASRRMAGAWEQGYERKGGGGGGGEKGGEKKGREKEGERREERDGSEDGEGSLVHMVHT